MAAVSAVYPPEMWALEALMILRNTHVTANLVHRNFENIVAQEGDVVHTRRPTILTVQTPANGAAHTPEAAAATDVTITLNQHAVTSFELTDRDMSTSIKTLINDFIEPAAIPIAKAVDDSLLGSSGLTSTTITKITLGAAAIVQTDFARVRGQLRRQKAPAIVPSTTHMILGVQHEEDSLKIDNFLKWDATGQNPPAILTGYLTSIFGMSIYADQGVPVDSSAADDQSVAFHKNAIALVTRPLEKPPADMGVRSAVVSMDGVGMRVVMSYQHLKLGWIISYDLLYGFQLLDKDLAVRISDIGGAA